MDLLRAFFVALLAVAIGGVSGCAKNGARNGAATTQPAAGGTASDPGDSPGGAAAVSRPFYLDVYQVALPFGAASRNHDFWRRIDEDLIDPPTHDLLLKNGLRVGLASNSEWDFFREQIERHPHFARSGSAVATGRGLIELPMKEDVPEQLIWFFSPSGTPSGVTYERCSDYFGVEFSPDPRRQGEMRITFSPAIKATRTVMQFTLHNEEKRLEEVRPEFKYLLNLRISIQSDRFLVLGLSPEADLPGLLGEHFMTLTGGAEKKEQLLIFVPRFATRKTPAATQRTPEIRTPPARSTDSPGSAPEFGR